MRTDLQDHGWLVESPETARTLLYLNDRVSQADRAKSIQVALVRTSAHFDNAITGNLTGGGTQFVEGNDQDESNNMTIGVVFQALTEIDDTAAASKLAGVGTQFAREKDVSEVP